MNLKDYDRIVVYPRLDGKLAWQYLAAGNSAILATDGGQGYEDRSDCLRAAFRVCGVTSGDASHPGSYEVQGTVYDLAAQPERAGTYDGGAVWAFPVRIPS